ncbi:hypothetical protein AZ66_29240 [Paenibacillus sp. E194]|uniref:hypothetical protein n=1 Tax=Paenibacillus sp. E194 TaxID=1458845 RepID=UPI0005CACFD7|nr:hypothetical protein [Paenibacillus sp. E194]KJB84714.1 hypothetical protein AZ66_29240 [Paenibacillus sp. E194]
MDSSSIITFISSAAFAAIVSGIVATRTNNKNMALKYITEERATWRKNVKEIAAKIYSQNIDNKQQLKELTAQLILNLNPLDEQDNTLDKKIIELLKTIEKGDPSQRVLDDFRDCVGILLKHDWERSKDEAKSFINKEDSTKLKRRTLGNYYIGKPQNMEVNE